MTNSRATNINIPVVANIVLFGASIAATQASIGILPATAFILALLLSATALSS
jgi:hypothetical protein